MNPTIVELLMNYAASNSGAGAKAAKAMASVGKWKEVFDSLKGEAKQAFDFISKEWIEMQDIAMKTGRSMAMSREMAMRYDRMLMQSTKDLARQYGITAKEIASFQEEYGKAVGRNVTLTNRQIESMAALSKITDSATAAQLVDDFDKLGLGIQGSTAKIGLMQERAKALGINATKATQTLKDNIKLAASYSFKNGVNDIEKMSLRATSLRMEMNAITNAMDKFMNIEDAITTSANLQMLGGSFAANFANPMGAMYEATADPEAFMKRLEKTIAGKGRYDEKTGTVQFDPVTMMTMREAAKQLGMSVDQLTNPAMASIQNEKVEDELRRSGNLAGWSPEELDAIKNLSRTNVDEKTGKHYVTYMDVNGNPVQRNIEELTKEELQIAQDRQLSEEALFSDVQGIKDILERTLGRARGTTSTKENLEGLGAEWDAFTAQFQNALMTTLSGWFNGNSFQPWDLLKTISYPTGQIDFATHGDEGFGFFNPYAFAEGGVVPHAQLGTIVKGSSTIGDKTPIMANAGEMILNQSEQKGLFDILKTIATTGAMMYGGNRMGKMFGMKGLGTNMALGNILSGGNMGIGGMLGMGGGTILMNRLMGPRLGSPMLGGMPMPGMRRPFTFINPNVIMNGNTIMNGNIDGGSIVDSFGDIADAAGDIADAAELAGKSTKTFSSRLRDLSKRDTFLGRNAKRYFDMGARGRAFRRKANIIRKATGRRFLNSKLISPIAQRYGNWQLQHHLAKMEGKDFMSRFKGSSFVKDIKSLIGSGGVSNAVSPEASTVARAATNTAGTIGKGGKMLGSLAKIGRLAGRGIPILSTALSIGSSIGDMAAASSQYDAQIADIERSGLSEREKARAKDRAAKEKNASYGSSIGGAAGSALGGTLGFALGGPLGAMAGAWLGEKTGSFIGKGIGGLFGGGEEEKLKKEELEKAKAAAGNSEEVVKVLKSIEGKMPTTSSIASNFGLKSPELSSSVLSSLPIVGSMFTGVKALLDNAGGKPAASGPSEIKLNVSGTIKLESNGNFANLDINKLLDNPEFVRKITDVVTRTMKSDGNGGKPKGGNGRGLVKNAAEAGN